MFLLKTNIKMDKLSKQFYAQNISHMDHHDAGQQHFL